MNNEIPYIFFYIFSQNFSDLDCWWATSLVKWKWVSPISESNLGVKEHCFAGSLSRDLTHDRHYIEYNIRQYVSIRQCAPFSPQDQWISGSFSPTSTGPRTPSESQHWRTMVSQPYRGPIPPGSAHEMLSLINALKLCFTGLFCALSTAYVWSPKQSLWSIIWSSWILLELNFYMSKAFPSSVRANTYTHRQSSTN